VADYPRRAAVDWASRERSAIVSGRRLRFVDYGTGPVVLLVHGMGGSWQSWLENIPALGQNHRVIAVDLPGFGDSEMLPADACFNAFSESLVELLDRLGVPSAVVVGHSFGGVVSLALASRAPTRVRAVVLVSGGGGHLSRIRLRLIVTVIALARILLSVPGMQSVVSYGPIQRVLVRPAIRAPHAVSPDLLRAMIPTTTGRGYAQALRLGVRGLESLNLSRVSPPVLLIWGRDDHILPLSVGQELAGNLECADLAVIDGVGHCAMFENPGAVNRLLDQFLEAQRRDDGALPSRRASARSWTSASANDEGDVERWIDGYAG